MNFLQKNNYFFTASFHFFFIIAVPKDI